MGLRDVEVKLIYDSSKDNIEKDLFIPLMQESNKYYRGIGYFSSNWIQVALEGIESIIKNNGKIYMITSPNLTEDDYEAIKKGNKAKTDEVIYNSIKQELEKFDAKDKKELLNFLSWLIAEEILEMKFAVCKNGIGIYHDKIAIFEDNQDMVCIHGSINASLQANFNGEGVSVFKSWGTGFEYCNEHKKRFMELWNGEREFYSVIDMPEKLKCTFRELSQNFDKTYIFRNNTVKKREPRKYQLEAIQKLRENNWQGIFEMATGTGKTLTSIFAMLKYKEEKGRQFLIVLVPFTHLVEQWTEELAEQGYEAILKCMGSKQKWYNRLVSRIKDYNSYLIDNVCIVSTYKTSTSTDFYEAIKKIESNLCLIADECHNMGTNNGQDMMLDNIEVRLGLSATPDRWFDEDGTQKIKQYFNKTVYEYTLEKAIQDNLLTPYYYYPIVTRLDYEEQEEYTELTRRISNYLNKRNSDEEDDDYIKKIYRKRRRIMNTCRSKYVTLYKLLKGKMQTETISHTLVYVAQGESKDVTKHLSDMGFKVHEFVYDVDIEDRKKILQKFSAGEYQILVAIKCLDEGVDIPSIKTAYFLSSTSNPREFIQRRGRILRTSDYKKYAELYDFIVFPYEECKNRSVEKNIIKKELPRFAEFAQNAENKNRARDEIYDMVSKYNLEPNMNKLPWEVYQEMREEGEGNETDEY